MHTLRWPTETGLFLLWALASTAGLLVFLGAFTIGLFVLPVAWLLLGAAALCTFRRPHREFVLTGLLLGPAVWSSYIGASWAARAYSADGTQSRLDLQRFLPFLAVTLGCAGVAVTLFVALGIRTHRHHPGRTCRTLTLCRTRERS